MAILRGSPDLGGIPHICLNWSKPREKLGRAIIFIFWTTINRNMHLGAALRVTRTLILTHLVSVHIVVARSTELTCTWLSVPMMHLTPEKHPFPELPPASNFIWLRYCLVPSIEMLQHRTSNTMRFVQDMLESVPESERQWELNAGLTIDCDH